MGPERARQARLESPRHPGRAPELARRWPTQVPLAPVVSSEAVLALQRTAGNRAVSSAIRAQRMGGGPGVLVQRGGRGGRRTRRTPVRSSSPPSKSSSTALTTLPPPRSMVLVPVTTAAVLSTPSVLDQAKQLSQRQQAESHNPSQSPEQAPTPSPSTSPEQAQTPSPSTAERAGELSANLAGGVLDVWEGVETVVDSSKDTATRGAGGAKVVGATTTLISSIGKEFELVGESGARLAGQVTETCGALGALGEFCSAASQAWSKSGTAETIFELVQKTAALAAGAMKTLDAYLDLSKTYPDFEKWVAKGAIPGTAIVLAAIKAYRKIHEMWGLSASRAKLMDYIESLKLHRKRRVRDQATVASKLIETIDSKWWKALVDVVSSGMEVVGELMKWSTVTLAVGAVVGGMSKVVPLVAKLVPVGYSLYASFSNWIWGSANATTVANGGTVVVKGEWDDLRDLISRRRGDPFGKLLCETLELSVQDAKDTSKVEAALQKFAA